ncbi:hypothetical protein LINPERHAP1_LOCUS34829, partial [Linum perenne]
YNQVLLAKQGWHILQNSYLLLSRILKARYFLTSNFVDARPDSRASWDWQGLLYGWTLFRSGLCWQPGMPLLTTLSNFHGSQAQTALIHQLLVN